MCRHFCFLPSQPEYRAFSFSADTPIATEDGDIPISEIDVGDEVLAYNEATGETDSYTVTDVLVHEDLVIVYLTIDGEIIETTPEHPFYTTNRGWVAAIDLREGDRIRNADGSDGVVEAVEAVEQSQDMYNLTVDEAHTFFVGDGQWLVHNTCWETGPPPGKYGIYRYKDLKDKLGRMYVGKATNLRTRLQTHLNLGDFEDYDKVQHLELTFVGDENPGFWLKVAERIVMFNDSNGQLSNLSNEKWPINTPRLLETLKTRKLPVNWPDELAIPTDPRFFTELPR